MPPTSFTRSCRLSSTGSSSSTGGGSWSGMSDGSPSSCANSCFRRRRQVIRPTTSKDHRRSVVARQHVAGTRPVYAEFEHVVTGVVPARVELLTRHAHLVEVDIGEE